MAPSKMTTARAAPAGTGRRTGRDGRASSGEGAIGFQDTGGPRGSRTAPVASGLVQPRIYTKRGDDGTTGLLYGGRVRKDSWRIELNGVVDEAQAAIGVARAETAPGSRSTSA